MKRLLLLPLVLLLAGDPPPRPAVGDPAPDFTLEASSGSKVTLSSFRGKKQVVLAFYPKAFTGG